MIIKIDHLALSSRDIDRDAKLLEEKGYKIIFKEKSAINLKIKENLLRRFNKFHDLCLLGSENSAPIEIIDHYHINDQQGYMLPIYENTDNKDKTLHFNTALIKTNKFNESIEFWKLFGFKEIKRENNIFTLEFKSPINRTNFSIKIKKDHHNKRPLLDDRGFNCIAFVSNSAQKEREFLVSKGIKTTPIEEPIINGKPLNIFFAIGPSGELVEVLSPKNT